MTTVTGRRGTVFPLVALFLSPTPGQFLSGAGFVVTATTSGSSISGNQLIGVITGVCAVITLVVLVITTSRKNSNDRIKAERDYDREIREAEERGERRQKVWTQYYKDLAEGKISRQPPPQQPYIGGEQ